MSGNWLEGLKVGDIVEITVAEEPYFSVGDRAVILMENDTKDGFWADFTINDHFYEDGLWCIQLEYSECKKV